MQDATAEPQRGLLPNSVWHVAAMILTGLLGLVMVGDDLAYYWASRTFMFDAHAYWTTGQGGYIPYSIDPPYTDAFLYSPAFAQAVSVVTWLPWPIFASLWATMELCAFLWLFRPLGWGWTAVLLIWCLPELVIGNIYGPLAVATVVAMTGAPQAWALHLLTKPVLGVGLFWHVVRREWRSLAVAGGLTLAITVVSFIADPSMWEAWFALLRRASSADPYSTLPLRVVGAACMVSLAAVAGWRWVVPFALLLALPNVLGISAFTILAAVPRLWLDRKPAPSGQA